MDTSTNSVNAFGNANANPNTDKAYQKLLVNLEEMTKVYRQLLEIVRKEKEFLLAADMTSLDENNGAKAQLLNKTRALDSLRVRYAQELAGLVGADTSVPRLLEIAQKLGGEPAEKLRGLHSVLEMVINRIVALNKENEEFAKSALRAVNGAFGEIKESLGGKGVYERKGTYKSGPETSGHFVKREA